MTDILTKCGKCGRESKVSEYAAVGAVKCPGCGAPLEFPSAVPNPLQLQIRRSSEGRPGAVSGGDGGRLKTSDEAMVAVQKQAMADVYDGVHKVREKTHIPLPIWNWVAFLALAGLLVGAQWYTTIINPRFFEFYYWGRFGVWGLVTLLVLIVAFEDSTGQGLLCLFAPLYIIYYAAVRVEYYWLRGLFMAVVVGLGAELYYLEDEAAVAVAQVHVNSLIAGVSAQIERVGSEAPEIVRQEPKRRQTRSSQARENQQPGFKNEPRHKHRSQPRH